MIVYGNANLNGASPPAATSIPATGYTGYTVKNWSPWGFEFRNDKGILLQAITPWETMTFPLPNGTQGIRISPLTSNDGSYITIPVSGVSGLYLSVDFETVPIVGVARSGMLSVIQGVQTVQFAAGQTVGISGSLNANITNASLTVAGSVNANITNANLTATVGGSVDANITNANLAISSVGSITEIVGTKATIQNSILPNNSLVFLTESQETVTNLANGSAIQIAVDHDVQQGSLNTVGVWDGVFVVVVSEGGYTYSPDWSLLFVGIADSVLGTTTYSTIGTSPVNTPPVSLSNGSTGQRTWGPALFPQAYVGNVIGTGLLNDTGATIASDTVHVWWFGIRAQVQVNNPTSSPAYTEGAAGSFGTPGNFDVSGTTNSNAQQTILASGGYISGITLTFDYAGNGANACGCNIYMGGVQIASVGVGANGGTAVWSYTWNEAVANTGFSILAYNGVGVAFSVYGTSTVPSSETPPQRVATVV